MGEVRGIILGGRLKRRRRRVAVAIVGWLVVAGAAYSAEPEQVMLWEHGTPGEPSTEADDQPALFCYRPPADEANPTAVIVCPGGGYGHLAMEKEGSRMAEWLNSLGVTACVLRYRHHGTGHRHPVPWLDGQRAVRTVRAAAESWNIDPRQIGMMGFSAGGHLASTVATRFDAGQPDAEDPVERVSSRPDFLILGYPVITMVGEDTHRGSRRNLLGERADELLLVELSSERQVTAQTPPTFLFHTDQDRGVPASNSVAFYTALRRAGVPAELHVYAAGEHGVGLAESIPATCTWPDRCRDWLRSRGLLTSRP